MAIVTSGAEHVKGLLLLNASLAKTCSHITPHKCLVSPALPNSTKLTKCAILVRTTVLNAHIIRPQGVQYARNANLEYLQELLLVAKSTI